MRTKPRFEGILARLCWRDERASQIAEFAVSLPLLVLFVVGIFDFSQALSLKQKLTNAAEEGARVAASDPASDMYAVPRPVSVNDAFYVVENYLLSENISVCGLPGTITQNQLTWTYANNTGCPGTMTLSINRGCATLVNGVNVVGTCVTITYPYKWSYSNVAGLFGPSAAPPGVISTTAAAFNEN
jgi:Flp pilus assembly protein TadG